mmetsp:Transcript_31382/g.48591  ORF Transcript_31382/g.48591 Transcript_31382/m.48591 type:complete len:96 (+) Transcript_31382:97-384(+)
MINKWYDKQINEGGKIRLKIEKEKKKKKLSENLSQNSLEKFQVEVNRDKNFDALDESNIKTTGITAENEEIAGISVISQKFREIYMTEVTISSIT